MTVETPKVLGYTTAGWASACGCKSMHPGSVIIRGQRLNDLIVLFIVNRPFWDLWYENKATLPGEELALMTDAGRHEIVRLSALPGEELNA